MIQVFPSANNIGGGRHANELRWRQAILFGGRTGAIGPFSFAPVYDAQNNRLIIQTGLYLDNGFIIYLPEQQNFPLDNLPSQYAIVIQKGYDEGGFLTSCSLKAIDLDQYTLSANDTMICYGQKSPLTLIDSRNVVMPEELISMRYRIDLKVDSIENGIVKFAVMNRYQDPYRELSSDMKSITFQRPVLASFYIDWSAFRGTTGYLRFLIMPLNYEIMKIPAFTRPPLMAFFYKDWSLQVEAQSLTLDPEYTSRLFLNIYALGAV